MIHYLTLAIERVLVELPLPERGKIFFNFWNYIDMAEDRANLRALGYGVDRFTTCCYVRGNISKIWWVRGSLACSFIKSTQFPFHCY